MKNQIRKDLMGNQKLWSLAGASIVLQKNAHQTAQLAAAELARYLYFLTGKNSPIAERLPNSGATVILSSKIAQSLGVAIDRKKIGEQGYLLKTIRKNNRLFVIIAATKPVGILYGVYGLLEELGMGFYAGGDTFPALPSRAQISADIEQYRNPAFAVRGNMLHYNFLCGCTNWGLDDYKFYFDQLARMRCNLLLMHWYDDEPGAAYEVNGEYLAGGVTPNPLTKPWGARESLRTSQYYFGSGKFFDEEIYSSPMGEDFPDLITEIKRTEVIFSQATSYALKAGVQVAAGFEAPRSDPTDRTVRERFRARLCQFLERNPSLSYFALWEHEGGGCSGSAPPPAKSRAKALMEQNRKSFAYLGNDHRIWEAIRFGEFAKIAAGVLKREFSHLNLVIVGWGGDRWMRFADYCLAYDKILPQDVIFTCHDNIDASFGPNVSTPWGQLPPHRQRWAMPWVEGDIDDCWVRQPNVESLGSLAPDALNKGCQGLLTLQWRTRDVEEETGYVAQYSWDTTLTPRKFYHTMARHAFGPEHEIMMANVLETLQSLGARWTGVRGTAECSLMQWTGWDPHFPFELEGNAPSYLLVKVSRIVRSLSEVPSDGTGPGEGAFHLRTNKKKDKKARFDTARLGIKEMKQIAARLKKLVGQTNKTLLRRELIAIGEAVYLLREKLVAYGMSTASYIALDSFLVALHQLHRNAGSRSHFATLRRLRSNLAELRNEYCRKGNIIHLERLDYLISTMDFVMYYDRAVMLMADGELVEKALKEAAAARKSGHEQNADRIAALAYRRLIAAGMQTAIEAFCRKLTTRCDFGTLTTINIKPVPLYWETIGRIEEYLEAVPPREVFARGWHKEVWVSWLPSKQTGGYHLYRRLEGEKVWRRINKKPLGADFSMFIDHPKKSGSYEYTVAPISQSGRIGPRSHVARAICGKKGKAPRIVACKPYSRIEAAKSFPLKVVVLTDREISDVSIVYRRSTDRAWKRVEMFQRFRYSYKGMIPDSNIIGGTMEWYVEARDSDGSRSVWPETADAGLPWSITVTG